MKAGSCRFFAGASHRSQFPKGRRPEVAFLGRSNVGKSSLINRLAGGPRVARVSGTPGRTQQVHFYLVDEAFFFVDLPGYGYARAPAPVRERLTGLIEEYLTGREALAAAILLVDARRGPAAADIAMGEWLRARDVPIQLVLTKIDKLPRGDWRKAREEAARAFGTADVIMFSSRTGEGREELWRIIYHRTGRGRTGT